MRDHSLRKRAVAEMHLRRWPVISAPGEIIQWSTIVDEADREAELGSIISGSSKLDPVTNPTHRSGRLAPNTSFSWERHNEGSSLTLFLVDRDPKNSCSLGVDAELDKAISWATSLPGEVVRSTRIFLVADDEAADLVMADVSWDPDELVSSYIGHRDVRMWSDFRIKEDGFGRLVVAANGANPRDFTRTLQQLQELGNYRNRALLGLPKARDAWPRLNRAEANLRDMAERLTSDLEPDELLLEDLSRISLDLAGLSTEIRFRMDATKAYSQIVEERLSQLMPRPIEGYSSLDDFTQRRFRPAMNTCNASTARLHDLERRAEQLSSLLRARIETRIEDQNGELLRSMERSISMQVRLQQLVEGLSVVALSYYVLGLAKFVLDGIAQRKLGLEPDLLLAWLVLPVVLCVWFATAQLKRRLFEEGSDK